MVSTVQRMRMVKRIQQSRLPSRAKALMIRRIMTARSSKPVKKVSVSPTRKSSRVASRRSLPLPAGISPASKLGQKLTKEPSISEVPLEPEVKKETLREKQMRAFKEKVELAKKYKQPVTITPRQYRSEMQKYGQPAPVISEWHPKTEVEKRRTKEGFEYRVKFPYAGAERYHFYKEKLKDPLLGFATALTGADPLGLKSAYYVATGKKEKAIQTKIEALHGVKEAQKGGWHGVSWYLSMPTTQIGLAAVGGEVVGAGMGHVAATSWGTKALLVSRGVTAVGKPLYTITASTAIKTGMGVGFGAMYGKETAPMVSKALDTGDWADVVGHAGVTALALPAGISGYKSGYATGFGRTEAYLYGKATYKPGSAEYIRYRAALKVARKLEVVKSHKAEPLDIAKDILRMDKVSAKKTIQFLKAHPKTVVGGSAASYTQIEGARSPRDIDLLLKGGDKQVAGAKKYFGRLLKTKRGEHRIDIHGKEMYKPGRHVEFGFESKTPRKISGTRYMKAGEQVFRKAISSVKKETQYRHFKDLPDFIAHSRSLIKSAKMKALTRMRGCSAEKHLETFLHPEKHPSFGKRDIYTRVFGKPKPTLKQKVIPLYEGGYTPSERVYYRYPGMGRMFPSYYGYTFKKPSYQPYSSYTKVKHSVAKPVLPVSPPPIKPPTYIPRRTPIKTPPVFIPDYSSTPPPPTKIIIPPPYAPPTKTTKKHFKPHRIKKPTWEDHLGRRKIQKRPSKPKLPQYKFRKFDIGKLFTGGKVV